MAALASDGLRHFPLLLWNGLRFCKTEITWLRSLSAILPLSWIYISRIYNYYVFFVASPTLHSTFNCLHIYVLSHMAEIWTVTKSSNETKEASILYEVEAELHLRLGWCKDLTYCDFEAGDNKSWKFKWRDSGSKSRPLAPQASTGASVHLGVGP